MRNTFTDAYIRNTKAIRHILDALEVILRDSRQSLKKPLVNHLIEMRVILNGDITKNFKALEKERENEHSKL